MCGIAGAIGVIDAEAETAVRAMIDAQVHRGPDDWGMHRSPGSPGIVFGFRRLSIIDLSPSGKQPMVDERSGNALVFNGEIYNYADLRADLVRDGAFRSTGDSEVLMRACTRWGSDALYRLRGMFAFAFYDPERRRVLLARDRLGIKPLYYAELTRKEGKLVLFASELRALLATGLFERHVDQRALATYLWNGFVVGPSTMVRGISLLPPGSSLSVSIDAPEPRSPRQYWSLAPRATGADASAVEELRTELETAMRQHLVSDVPLGVFLSGGIDSSAVTALAVRAGGSRVKTFHVSFDESAFDESVYARSVANALGTDHADFRLTQSRFRAELPKALESLDQPSFDAINTYFVSRVVREAGFTVALAGTGGDELFGGYRTFRDLPRGHVLGRLSRYVPSGPLASAIRLALSTQSIEGVPPQKRWGKLPEALSTKGDLVHLYQLAYGLFTREFLTGLANPSTIANLFDGLPHARSEELRTACARLSPLAGVALLELSLFIGERLMRDTDAASMAVSLEVRVPLLDHRVVESAQSLSDERRFRPLGKKSLLRSLAMPELDPKLFDRPKAGFVLPIELWAKDQLVPEIEATFADRDLVSSIGMHHDALGRLWRAFRADAPGIYWSRVWAPYVLLDWCRRHRVTLA